MIGSTLKLALLDNIEPRTEPVLSLYIDVYRGNPDNVGKAFILRAAEAMRGLDLDKGYINQVSDKLNREYSRAEGRSLVIFAGEDPDETFDGYYLQTALPFLGATDGVLAHWGRPLIAPLLFELDQRERYGVVYVAADRVRVFEAFLGQADELADFARTADTEDWVSYRHARRSPGIGAGVAARGGADVDSFDRRMAEATARLYRGLLPDLEDVIKEGRIGRLILVGQPPAIAAFEGAMPSGMKELVAGTLPPPSNPDAAAHEWQPHVADLIAKTEVEHELALLDRIRESGVWGKQETLTLLQERRLHTLMVPWSELPNVYLTKSGRVASSAEELRLLEPGADVSEVNLLEVLPKLVRDTGTVLEFAEGPAEERLNEEFGGLAGINRW